MHNESIYLQSVNFSDNSVVALCKAFFGPGPGSILLGNANAIGVQNSLPSDDSDVKCGGKVMGSWCKSDVSVRSGSVIMYTSMAHACTTSK